MYKWAYNPDNQQPKKQPQQQQSNDRIIVKFNVGGTQFATMKSTLTKKIRKQITDDDDDKEQQFYEPHLLEQMLTGDVDAVRDSNNEAIFIDRDPKYFQHILNFLRLIDCNDIFNDSTKKVYKSLIDSEFLDELIEEAEYFGLASLKDILTGNHNNANPSLKSLILRRRNLQESFNALIKDKEQLRNKQWTLLYRASEDGFDAKAFHRKCNHKGCTLTIIKSRDTHHVFGGFTAANWATELSGNQYILFKSDSSAFIFSLINNESKPLVINCSSKDAIYSDSIMCRYGPYFGSSDLVICSNANIHSGSHSNCSFSYKLADGYKEDSIRAKNYLAGSHEFFVSEIEVFQIHST